MCATHAGGESTAAGWMGVLLLAVMAFALGQTALCPALPEIARQLGTTRHAASWTITAYLLAAYAVAAAVALAAGLLALRIPSNAPRRRRVVVALSQADAGPSAE